MLFDLRGRGRQRTVRVIYLGLALLMGGGLVLFGIGSSGTGGLLDAVTGGNGSSKSSSALSQDQVDAAEKRIALNRKDAGAWDELARASYTLGTTGSGITDQGTLTKSGTASLQQADHAWTEYLTLVPNNPDPNTAVLMLRAYSALGNDAKAVNAAEIYATSHNDVGSYLQYAQVAYAANQSRTGDLAGAKAEALATKDQKAAITSQVQEAKSEAVQAQAQQAQQGATGTTSSTPLTPGGAAG